MQMEKYQTAFTNMLGSAEKAASALQQIKEDAARTPLDVASLVQANQLLISAGVDAGEARKTILALGDAVAAAGGGNAELSRMAQNLQQVKNVGKAASIDIKQFAYAGIDIYGILADYTGKSTAEVQKMTITYDLLTAALQRASEEGGRYYNAMETQSQTLSGRLDTLRDNWSQLLGSLSEGLADVEGDLVSAATEWVQTLQTSFEEYGAKGLMEAGGSIVNDIANGIADHIPQLAEQAGAAVQRFSDYLVENMETIVETGGNLLASLADGILNAFPDIANAAVQTVGTLASELWANADKIFEQGAQLVGKLCEGLLSVLGNVIEATGTIAEAIVTKIFSTDWGAVGKNIVSAIGQGISNGIASLSGPLDRLSYKLNHALGKVGYAEYNSFEAWAAANGKTDETEYQHGSQKDDDYWRRYGEQMAAQYGLNEKTEPEPTGTGGDGAGVTPGKTTTPKHVAADTKKLADTIKETSQEILAGTGNIVGSIQRVTETADNTYNVYDGTTKQLKGTTKETAQTITETWTQVVDGQEQNFKRVQTLLDGVVTSTKTTSDAVAEATRTATNTRTETVKGTEDMVGNITRTTETTTQTAKAVDAVTGEIKDTVISATEVVTDCYTRIKDGQKQTVTETKTYVNGVLTDVKEKSEDLNADLQNTEGILGGFSSFILDLDTKLGGLEKAAQSLKKSPLGSWFYDMAKGYRAWDSFWDNVDVGSLITNGLVAFATGYTNTQNGGLANGLQTMMLSVMSNLVGVNLSSLQGLGSTWGGDLVKGMASGMVTVAAKSGILMKALKIVATVVKSFLGFSCPDKGPLHEYETWMPDMLSGMADGIKNNAYILRNAARDVSGDLYDQMQYDVGMASPSYEQNYKSSTVKLGGVTMTIQAQPGMDEEKLAQYTIDRLSQMINEEAASSGQIPVF